MGMLSILGLAFIVVAWVFQLTHVWGDKKSKGLKLYKWFVVCYIIGVALLTYEAFTSGPRDIAFLNLFSLLLAGLVMSKAKL